jgi:hypothetical protein
MRCRRQVSPDHGEPGLHKSFLVLTTLTMETGHSSLCDYVAGEMEKSEEIKWDYDGFTGACAGTTEYSFDYEIHG